MLSKRASIRSWIRGHKPSSYTPRTYTLEVSVPTNIKPWFWGDTLEIQPFKTGEAGERPGQGSGTNAFTIIVAAEYGGGEIVQVDKVQMEKLHYDEDR